MTFIFLICVTTGRNRFEFVFYGMTLLAALLGSRLPITQMLLRAAVVLPFSLTFAIVSLLAGDPERAVSMVFRSYLSALAVLLLVGSTRLPDLLRALEWFRVPGILILVSQFLYRYLFVLSEQGQHMRLAAQCRAGVTGHGSIRRRLQAAAGALSVLFAKSYQRADGVHRAMLARGFTGHFPALSQAELRASDFIFLTTVIVGLAAVRFAVVR